MRYVYVAGKPTNNGVDLNRPILQQTGLCLYSLIEGLRQAHFNTHTVDGVLTTIDEYIRRYVTPVGGTLYADSGGYSIITGAVHPADIHRFVQCYNKALERPQLYGRIFSLDIPWSKTYHFMNTKAMIAELNHYAMSTARDILDRDRLVRENYHFVWHFKMESQYDVWNDLYDKLEMNRFLKRRAIGGMVALRGMTNIRYSPFTAMAYRCLADYLDAEDYGREFSLHYLGMYLPYDRFHMAMLESLFRLYLEDIAGVSTTYDSINFEHTARMNKDLRLYRYAGGELQTEPNLIDASDEILDLVYQDPVLVAGIKEEVDRRRAGIKLRHANAFGPLNIFSNQQIDLFFQHVVKDSGLTEMIHSGTSLTRLNHELSQQLLELEGRHPEIFSAHMRKATMKNLEHTFAFHRWFREDRSHKTLDELVRRYIRAIRFPAQLS